MCVYVAAAESFLILSLSCCMCACLQGATKSMVIDHGYLLEGQYAHELPEVSVSAAGRSIALRLIMRWTLLTPCWHDMMCACGVPGTQVLLGAARFKHLDMTQHTLLATEQELAFVPVEPKHVANRQAEWASQHGS